MRLVSGRFTFSIALFVLAVMTVGCEAGVAINGVDDIANVLENRGIAVESREPLPKPEGKHFRFDEAIALNGPELRVEIVRIDDEKVYKIARSAGVIIALGEYSAGQRFPGRPDLYMSQPYMIVVRQEPTPGQVHAELQKILTFDAAEN